MAVAARDDVISRNPTSGEVLARFTPASEDDVLAAVKAARAEAPEWEQASPLERGEGLLTVAAEIERRTDEFTDLIVTEVGKPLREAREEVRRAAAIVRYHAGSALDPHGETYPSPGDDLLVYTARRPLGHVGLITPWNFPIAIPLWKLAPALAYGNAVVMKPAPHAAAVGEQIGVLFSDFPVRVVHGGAETGQALARAPLAGLSFTGSTAAGRDVAQLVIRSGARFQAELGGKNASVVLADADLALAARVITGAAFGFAGQKCTATSRVVVERPVAERFCELLAEGIDGLVVGDPADEATDVGPLIDGNSVARMEGFLERAVESGARIVTGGGRRPDLGESFFEPTLVDGADAASELVQTEIFGPVLALLVADTANDALALANAVEYGLSAAVFTRSLDAGLRFAERLEAGIVRVNGPTPGVLFNAPFGPAKASGIGLPEQGKAARDFFTRERTVSVVGG
jgi:alpha-ketoglutaric semialdehyde dehydrogenase